MTNSRTIQRTWELVGILVIFSVGSMLHFAFGWLDRWPPAALFAAVNESTWEHLKMAFWAGVIYAAFEYPFLRRRVTRFWSAKGIGLLVTSLAIIALYYGYKAIVGYNILAVDISLFFVAIVAGQVTSMRLMSLPPRSRLLAHAGVVLLVAQIAAFAMLTFNPPRFFLFQDPRNQTYGIPRE